ncbi:MAG TPA: hypothetical protein QF509_08395 [Rhodospirillales bacterium]|nr:hypothetical protein [Rhodospirillales bacterium]
MLVGVPQLATQPLGPIGGTEHGLAVTATGVSANRAAREDAATRDCFVKCIRTIESLHLL